MNKFTRQISIIAALALLLIGVFFYQNLKSQKAPPPRKPAAEAFTRSVEVFRAQNENITSDLMVQGRLVAWDKIDIFAEVSGKLLNSSKPFKVGSYFGKGTVLLQIDDTEAKLSLLAQKSTLLNSIAQILPDLKIDYPASFPNWNAYVTNFDMEASIKELPAAQTEQERLFIISKNLHNQFYTIQSQEERLSKYRVLAPFSGVITSTSINPGSLVRSGQKMGELMNKNNYELEATVRLADLKYVQVGSSAQLFSTELDHTWTGKVRRISDQIDPNTQTVIVYISVNGSNLREGMYLRGQMNGRTVNEAIEIPRDLIVNQNSIFTVEQDSILALQPVEILNIGEKKAIIRGVANGALLLKDVFAGAHNGQIVKIKKIEDQQVSSLN